MTRYTYIYRLSHFDRTECGCTDVTNLYYLNATDTHWALGKIKNALVYYIRVKEDGKKHKSAVYNTATHRDSKDKLEFDLSSLDSSE